jgi:tetratricopeptide (TPR) repeat protein
VAIVRWPAAGFLGLAFFLTLAPTSSVVPITTEVGAERRMYLPLAALAVLVAAAGGLLIERFARRASRRFIVTAMTAIAVLWISALAVRTVYRNTEYGSAVSIWQTSVERRPHGRARLAYAVALGEREERDAALVQLREAVRDYPEAGYALGTELAASGKVDEGIEVLQQFMRDRPEAAERAPTRRLLGQLLVSSGRLEEAEPELRAIVDQAPTNVDARMRLGDLLVAQRRYAEAESEYRTLLARGLDDTAVLARIASALALSGRIDDAVATYEQILTIDPGSLTAHLRLGELLMRLRRSEDVKTHATAALSISPRSASAHNLLGAALAEEGRLAEAIAHFREAVALDPGNTDSLANLSQALKVAESRPPPNR